MLLRVSAPTGLLQGSNLKGLVLKYKRLYIMYIIYYVYTPL